jgi:hypothetical protein
MLANSPDSSSRICIIPRGRASHSLASRWMVASCTERRPDEISNLDRIERYGRGIARWVCIHRLMACLAPALLRFLRHLHPHLVGTIRLLILRRILLLDAIERT